MQSSAIKTVTAHIPLALVLGLLSVLILVSYFESPLMQ